MPQVRFNYVFVGLMLVAGVCAFAVPAEYSNLLKGRLDGLFYPVSAPLRRLAGAVSGRLGAGDSQYDSKGAPEEAQREIQRLKLSVANLTVQLQELRQLYANRELAGDVHKYSLPFAVIGGDQGSRESLVLKASSADGLTTGMPVVHRDGIVGRITAVGAGGAQVRLVTDRGFRVAGAFGKFQRARDGSGVEFVPTSTPPPLVEGRGNGLMGVSNLTIQQLQEAGVKAGDWVVLRDPDDWPLLVNGYLLGYVERIEEQAKMRLFAEVTIRPRVNLLQLREVMVVTGKPVNAGTATPAAAPVHAPAKSPPAPAPQPAKTSVKRK